MDRTAFVVLGGVVLVQAAGLALTAARDGTALGTFLFTGLRWPEASSQLVERGVVLLTALASGVAVFARPGWRRAVGAAVASSAFALLAALEWQVGGAPFTALTLPAHATRIAAPALMAVWHLGGARRWVLRGAIALTFAVHGLEALWLHPGFVDFLIAADMRWVGLGLGQQKAELLLRLIGVADLIVAALVLTGRDLRPILAWAAFWGVVTAGSRVVQGGEGALHHTLIRAANGGLPLVLLLSARNAMTLKTPAFSAVRLARAAVPALLLLLPLAAGAQALDGDKPAHLRLVWTEEPSTKATLSWSTTSAGTAHDVYLDTTPRAGDLGAYAHKVPATVNGAYRSGGPHFHHAQLTGLQPGTSYYFVLVSDGNVSAERHFVTAHADDRNFRLLFGGDSRSGVSDRRKMNQLMAHLVEQDPGIVALAHGGDYIDIANSWTEWNSWLEDHALTVTSSGRVLPIIPARGNHEGDGKMFNQVFGDPGGPGADYYVTRLGEHVTFITLDSNVSMGGDQRAWLEQQLQAAQDGRWIIPSYHRPAFPAVKTPSGALQFFVPLFEKYDVDVVCESDGHVLKRTVPIRDGKHDPTGIVYVGEGGLGVPQRTPIGAWYLKPPGMAKSAHHVQVFSFSPDELVYEARLMNGAVDDAYTFLPRRTPASTVPPDSTVPPGEAPAPPDVASLATESDTRLRVTFSADMDPGSVGSPAAYALSPDAEVRDVAVLSPRVVTLVTSPLAEETDYLLTVRGVRSAEGGVMADPRQIPFRLGSTWITPAPELTDPGAPDGPAGGCTAATGAGAWALLMVVGVAVRRRRATRP